MVGMTIAEFLLARFAEDEAAASEELAVLSRGGVLAESFRHAMRRVLAECAAKRRIVEWLGHTIENEFGWDGMDWFVLKQLASVYADHTDFDEEWRA